MTEYGAAIVNAIARGQAVLLTGAGFSRGLIDHDGEPLPLSAELAESIWPIAFRDEPFEPETPLNLVYAEAIRMSQTLLGDQLNRHFRVDPGQVPSRYETWYSLPWHRIYTLNIDDGDEVIQNRAGGRGFQVVSSLGTTPGIVEADKLAVVHVNGRLDDFPNLTFSQWDYADRTTRTDTWYREFVTDLTTRPVVVVGSVLDEPPLWHYLQLRGERGNNNELRPRSWLVSPKLDRGRKATLARLNFAHIAATEEEFFQADIEPFAARLVAGQRADEVVRPEAALIDVSAAVRAAPAGSPDYLLGTAPRWADVVNGYAANFEFDELLTAEVDALTGGTIAVTGSAGSGKTTSLMKAAAVLAARGNTVLWLGRESEVPMAQIRREALKREADYLFIDDLDRFADQAPGLLRSLSRDAESLVTVVAVRSARYVQLRYGERLRVDATLDQARLTDGDAEALLGQLRRGNRLGALLGLSTEQRIESITKHADRQLLVTLIEATSGERFHERVAGECRSLQGADLALYGEVCTAAWADNRPLSRQDVLYAAGRNFEPNEVLAALRRLETSRLLTVEHSRYRARHRVIAESAIDYFRSEGQLEHWIEDLLFLVAGHYDPGSARRTRYGRILIRLLSHSNLKSFLGDNAVVQRIYGSAEEWLAEDPHFWLQRGSFETDYGNLVLAENFLRQARVIAPDDVLIDTAWAMLLLKKALNDLQGMDAHALVEEAFGILKPIMRDTTSNSPHTFAIYLNFGLRWLREQRLGNEEQRLLRDELLYFGRVGAALHPRQPDVQEAWGSVQRYIATNAIVEASS